jgi:hypothetical protein
MKRVACLAIVVGMVSCRRGPRPAAQDTVTADPLATHASPSTSAADASSTLGDAHTAPSYAAMCPDLVAPVRAALAKATLDAYGDATPVPSTPIGFCADSAAGAWLVELPATIDADVATAQYQLEARYVVTFVRRNGGKVQHVAKETLANYGLRTSPSPWTYDYDHDGIPELYLETKEDGDEGHTAKQIELLTFRGGAIVPYAPATTIDIDGALDVDGDGRPDLLTVAGYDETLEGCGSGFPYDPMPALFAAHARDDGTFTLDDATTRAHAAKWCPASPAKIASSQDAICARLRAVDVPRERARVAASCTDFSCEDSMAGRPQKPGAADDCARRRIFFDRTPPLTLP